METTEWGVRSTWPDGHSEVRTVGKITGRPLSRRDAEISAWAVNGDREDGDTEATAEVVSRIVTASEWTTVIRGVPSA